MNYEYRQGEFFPGSNGYNEIYIIDFLSGDILFQHRTSEYHIYGVNWRQGFESCSLKHNVSLNENGEIIVENKIAKSGLGDMPQTKNGKIKYNRKMIPHFCFLPTMEIQKGGIYILTDGEYILRE